MDKERSLTSRKERALAKSQRAGNLIDKHLGQLTEQKPRDSEGIHEIEFGLGKYVGQIKDGVPHGLGAYSFNFKEREFKEKGNWDFGRKAGFFVESRKAIDRKSDLVSRDEIRIDRFLLGDEIGRRVFYARYHPLTMKRSACLIIPDSPNTQSDSANQTSCHFRFSGNENALTDGAKHVFFDWDLAGNETPETHLMLRGEECVSVMCGDNELAAAIARRWIKPYGTDRIIWEGPVNRFLSKEYERPVIISSNKTFDTFVGWYATRAKDAPRQWEKDSYYGISAQTSTSDQLMDIFCGWWTLVGKKGFEAETFYGIKLELNFDLHKCRGPFFYEYGEERKFDLFEVE